MLDELRKRMFESKIRNLDNELESAMEDGKNQILIKILKKFKGREIKSLPTNIQQELIQFKKNKIASLKKTVDYTSPYISTKVTSNPKQINADKIVNTGFNSITVDQLQGDYEKNNK